ncbi:type II secretion system F family protein [Helicovermis profundi]|uniref:Type II secretion system protein GspF domain-containing protein n=1 Tax=Helicovermis profundi TaxID=3065157 RepID=A0AAU9E589_9FIRM|nr:hypothetical protein HLPR_19490 [Clostridia bacterium S502]
MSIILITIIIFQKIILRKRIVITEDWLKILNAFPIAFYISEYLYKYKFIKDNFNRKTVLIFGSNYGENENKQLLSFIISCLLVSFTTTNLVLEVKFGLSFLIFLYSILIAIVISSISYFEINMRIKKNVNEIIDILPYFVGRLYTYLLSGMTLKKAIYISVESEKNYFNYELLYLVENLNNGESIINEIDNLLTMINITSIKRLKSSLITFIRVGNIESLENIKNLENDIMIERKQRVKIKGESLKVKMVFPLILFFLGTVLMLTVPTIMSLQ